MPTPNPTGAISVTLVPEHAPCLARHLINELNSGLEASDLVDDRDDLARVRNHLARWEAKLDQIAWGTSSQPVKYVGTYDELRDLAKQLMDLGADMAGAGVVPAELDEIHRSRYWLRGAEAGASILDQLDAKAAH